MIKAKQTEKGFTTIELLISIPIASIVLVTLFAALFTQYTSVLAESARSNLRTSGQTLLINLQDELLFTIAYGEQMDVNLTDPYEPIGGWAHNSDPQTLIINEVALDSTRRDEDRHIVRREINDCATSSVTANPVAINNVIYFVQDNPDSDFDSLYKRTIVPTYNLCGIDQVSEDPCSAETSTCLGNAKVTTCPEANVGTGNCEQKDSLLTDKVVDIDIQYFSENNVSTPFPSAADKLEVTLTLGDKVYGRNVEVEVKHTIRKIN